MMKTKALLTCMLLPLLVTSSCKPTPRTAKDDLKPAGETPNSANGTETPPAPPTKVEQEAELTPPAQEIDATLSLVTIKAAQQDYALLRPWEKKNLSSMTVAGIYLGDGQVLTAGQIAKSATFLELSLPDGSRSVPARVLRYDPDLQLAIITNKQPKDKDFFESREALVLGEPLRTGEMAEYWGTIAGKDPLRIPLNTKGNMTTANVPRLVLQSPQIMPSKEAFGYPLVSNGKLRAMTTGFAQEQQSFYAINAELIKRFIDRKEGEAAGIPIIGIALSNMDDPALSSYLKLAEGKTGAYVSKVDSQGAAAKAGIQAQDVILAINDYTIDNQCTVQHELYGRLDARALISSLSPLGDTLNFSISRQGEELQIPVKLTREAKDKSLTPQAPPNEQPRYIIHGGLVFQPLSQEYMQELKQAASGNLPLEFLSIEAKADELRKAGYQELTALTIIIPSPVNIGYKSAAFCLVEKVNGKKVHNFSEMASLLDEATADGITSISINKAPYTLYLDRKETEASNDAIRKNIIPQLRQLAPKN